MKKEDKIILNPYIYKIEKDFNLGKLEEKVGNIFLKIKYNNMFLTLTDLNNKVIKCESAGSSLHIRNKRKKRIIFTVENMALNLNNIFKQYNIKFLNIISFIRLRGKGHFKKLIKKLKELDILILKITSRRIIAHNGVKGKNKKRL